MTKCPRCSLSGKKQNDIEAQNGTTLTVSPLGCMLAIDRTVAVYFCVLAVKVMPEWIQSVWALSPLFPPPTQLWTAVRTWRPSACNSGRTVATFSIGPKCCNYCSIFPYMWAHALHGKTICPLCTLSAAKSALFPRPLFFQRKSPNFPVITCWPEPPARNDDYTPRLAMRRQQESSHFVLKSFPLIFTFQSLV